MKKQVNRNLDQYRIFRRPWQVWQGIWRVVYMCAPNLPLGEEGRVEKKISWPDISPERLCSDLQTAGMARPYRASGRPDCHCARCSVFLWVIEPVSDTSEQELFQVQRQWGHLQSFGGKVKFFLSCLSSYYKVSHILFIYLVGRACIPGIFVGLCCCVFFFFTLSM